MSNSDARERARQRIYSKYDNAALETGIRLKGEKFLGYVERLDDIDPEYAHVWLNSIYGFSYSRSEILDDRTRELTLIGQHIVLGNHHALDDHFDSALRCGATPREILEVILISRITGGVPRAHLALMIWREFMKSAGVEQFGERPLYDRDEPDG